MKFLKIDYIRTMIKKGFVLSLLVLMFSSLRAQDPQFSQYYASPLYLNPGFAGTSPKYRLTLQSRIQWPSLPQAYVTHAFGFDVNVDKFNSGFGFLITNDRAGSAALNTTNIGLIYAYKFYIGKQFILSPGLNFSYGARMIDKNKLLSTDQIQFSGGSSTPPTVDPDLLNLRNVNYFDFAFGSVLYNPKMWVGVTVNHLNKPNTSFIQSEYRLPMKITAHAGFKIPLNKGFFASDRPTFVSPSFIYRTQAEFDQFDIGVNYYYQPVNIGIWYRGIPIQRTAGGYMNNDALIFLIGFSAWNFDFNYSYDFTISKLGPATNGAHEFSMAYRFNVGKFRKLKERHKPIPCPAFYDDGLELNLPAWLKRR
jgi:type IX secretion system PorP/SprF family membrane protein